MLLANLAAIPYDRTAPIPPAVPASCRSSSFRGLGSSASPPFRLQSPSDATACLGEQAPSFLMQDGNNFSSRNLQRTRWLKPQDELDHAICEEKEHFRTSQPRVTFANLESDPAALDSLYAKGAARFGRVDVGGIPRARSRSARHAQYLPAQHSGGKICIWQGGTAAGSRRS